MGTDKIVAGGREIHDKIRTGIGRKQMGQSSLTGGSLKKGLIALLDSTLFAECFMLRPMIPLALGVAILDEHTSLTCLETNGTSPLLFLAAIGT
jgi:hypothetical protein